MKMTIKDGYLREMAKTAREFRVPTDRVYAACEKYLEVHNCGWMAALVIIEDRLMDTGQPEPLEEARCINCRGTKGNPLSGCRMRFHGGDVFGWEPVRVPEKAQPLNSVSDLLPCRECGEIPTFNGSKTSGSYRYSCLECKKHALRCAKDTAARKSWNRRFGRLPECDRCHSPIDDTGRCTALFGVCAEQKKLTNPHDLTLCKCGKVPQPVAYVDDLLKQWYWGHQCDCGVRGGHYSLVDQVGWMLREYNGDGGYGRLRTRISSHRYDLPTDLVLGNEKLPEEYQ